MSNANWAAFAAALREARESAGFPSARAFYIKSGGRRFFGATYRQYLNVENGLSGPGPQLVEKIALALQLASDKARARSFFRSYLGSVLGSEGLLELIAQALSAAAPASGAGEPPPLQKALARQSEARAQLLSREQADLIDSSLETFWLWNLLINDSGRWTPEQLSRMTGIKAAACADALKALSKAGLIAKDAKGLYYCENLRRVFRFPRDEHFALGRDKHARYLEQMGRSQGKTVFRHYTLFRGSEKELLDYAPHLRAAVEGANICETTERGADTAFTSVEVVARKLFPF